MRRILVLVVAACSSRSPRSQCWRCATTACCSSTIRCRNGSRKPRSSCIRRRTRSRSHCGSSQTTRRAGRAWARSSRRAGRARRSSSTRSRSCRWSRRRAPLREAHSTGVLIGLAQEPVAAAGYGFGWSMHRSCRFNDSVAHNGAIDSHRAGIEFSPSRGIGMVGLTNFPMGDPQRIIHAAFVELDKSGALEPRVAEVSPRLVDAGKKLLGVYHQWDEAALKALLGRPIDPREQDELATYKRLHGTCTDMTVTETDGIASASFAVKCERGAFELRINADGKGLLLGFIGFSRGVEMPKPLATAAKAIVSLHGKWDDKLAAKYLAKTPVPLPEMKKLAAQFRERHGDCEVRRTIHEGFDWGYDLACKKEDVEMMFTAAPADPAQLVGINLRPVHGAQKKCD